ncbi:hypothetical protein GE061_010952 [Apolygus lucorum]|uniref:Uncharacterized protein n=1 Tax=Apolygus lucorum TaxID=248454 RepID=A0A8S9Y058_APOLU|nr:hypothetical protein GE061_010952 [Apolygus lucorum]
MGQEDLKYLKCMKETLTAMLAATKKQPNISQIVKDGLNTMEEMCDALVTQEKRRTSVQKRLKAEVDKLTKWSPSKERSHGSRKRRKEDETDLSNSEEDCMETETSSHVVSDSDTAGVPFEKVKSRKGRQDLAKEAQRKAAREARRDADRIRRIKQQAEVEAQKKEAEKKRKESEEKRRAEQDGRRKRKEAVKRDMQRNLKRSQALVIKVSDQISYAEKLKKLRVDAQLVICQAAVKLKLLTINQSCSSSNYWTQNTGHRRFHLSSNLYALVRTGADPAASYSTERLSAFKCSPGCFPMTMMLSFSVEPRIVSGLMAMDPI